MDRHDDSNKHLGAYQNRFNELMNSTSEKVDYDDDEDGGNALTESFDRLEESRRSHVVGSLLTTISGRADISSHLLAEIETRENLKLPGWEKEVEALKQRHALWLESGKALTKQQAEELVDWLENHSIQEFGDLSQKIKEEIESLRDRITRMRG